MRWIIKLITDARAKEYGEKMQHFLGKFKNFFKHSIQELKCAFFSVLCTQN